MENKYLKEIIDFVENDKVLSKMKLDILGKDLRSIITFMNMKKRGDKPVVRRDFNGFLRVAFKPKKNEFKQIEDFKNNRQIYQKYTKSLDNIISFEEFIKYSKGHKIALETLINILNDLKFDKYKKFTKGLYIFGDSQLGKTTIAKTFIYNLNKLKIDAEILKAQTITELALSNNKEIIFELKSKKVLFIDDIGLGILSEYHINQLIEILDYRFENNLFTNFTSNLSPEALLDLFTKRTSVELARRLYSRIKQLTPITCEFTKLEGDKKND